MNKTKHLWAWASILCWLLFGLLTPVSAGYPLEDGRHLRYIRAINTADLGLPSPGGLTYQADAGALVVVGADLEFRSHIALISPFEELVGSLTLDASTGAPAGIAYDEKAERLLLFDVTFSHLVVLKESPGGQLDASRGGIGSFDARPLGVRAPRGMVVDPASGRLWILDGAGPLLIGITPGAQGDLDGASAVREGRIARADLQHTDMAIPLGLALNPANGHLFSLSSSGQELYEFTQTGHMVKTHDLAAFGIANPQGLTFAPSGDPTDDPSIANLYIADGGSGQGSTPQATGEIVELSFTAAPGLVPGIPVVVATLERTTDTSVYSPPSPDPSGIAYVPDSGRLVISDSEVEKLPCFGGKNVFVATLAGELLGTHDTFAFSSEPTGVAYDPVRKHLFFSDDDWRRVFILDPGEDGLAWTEDDVETWINSSAFGSMDPEGISFDSRRRHLLVADQLGEEVYDVGPGVNGIFDGVPPVGDDVYTHFDTTGLGIQAPESVEFDSSNRHYYVQSSVNHTIAETRASGELVRYIDTTSARARMAAGLAYAPASDGSLCADGSPQLNLYVTDRGLDDGDDPDENDGKVYEMSFEPLAPDPITVRRLWLPLVIR